ncbi:MAG TPA: hypothetical protein VKY85_12900 [Candidatus Angelobacter sp.]|nr:hypothetical protein [Candidatus Angelobacter sp.]
MADQQKPNPGDELLDSLLAAYSDVEPRPGMETRLLANLRAESLSGVRNQRWGWRWLWAGAGVVAPAVALVVIYWSQIPGLPSPPQIKALGPPSLPPTVMSHESGRRLNRGPQISRPASVSIVDLRQQVFPTPAPLSDQERLLLRYLAGTPRDEVAAQSRVDEPAEETGPLGPQVQQFTATEGQIGR